MIVEERFVKRKCFKIGCFATLMQQSASDFENFESSSKSHPGLHNVPEKSQMTEGTEAKTALRMKV